MRRKAPSHRKSAVADLRTYNPTSGKTRGRSVRLEGPCWLPGQRAESLAPQDDGLARVFELAFSRHAFKRFLRVLDPILIIGAVRRQEPDHLIGAVGGHVTEGTGRQIERLADAK